MFEERKGQLSRWNYEGGVDVQGWKFGGGDVANEECGDTSEWCPLDWKRSLLVPLHKDGDMDQEVIIEGLR